MRVLLLTLCLLLLPATARAEATAQALIDAAIGQTDDGVTYNGAYFTIAYPGGDIPAQYGVCTDVIVRAYRALGIDLQKLVHEDMKAYFGLYPKLWGLTHTDTNIDHRRVPNLQVFFKRHGQSLPVTQNGADYKPGDMVTWNLRGDGGSLPHIGIVTDRLSADGQRPLIVHNIGAGPAVEDMLFGYKITGHFRYALP